MVRGKMIGDLGFSIEVLKERCLFNRGRVIQPELMLFRLINYMMKLSLDSIFRLVKEKLISCTTSLRYL